MYCTYRCRRYEIAAENKRLSEPLARALKEVEGLRAALASADKDKASLAQTKARLAAAEKQVSVQRQAHQRYPAYKHHCPLLVH